MKKQLITSLHRNFENFVHREDGVEFWFEEANHFLNATKLVSTCMGDFSQGGA